MGQFILDFKKVANKSSYLQAVDQPDFDHKSRTKTYNQGIRKVLNKVCVETLTAANATQEERTCCISY